MVRTLQDEVERYGPYSLAVESRYDHPMLWGSKRTGPDLARLGGKYSDQWHTVHLKNPRDVVPESIMPRYNWLSESQLQTKHLGDDLRALRAVGVPYTERSEEHTSELQSLMRISYAVFCLKKKTHAQNPTYEHYTKIR